MAATLAARPGKAGLQPRCRRLRHALAAPPPPPLTLQPTCRRRRAGRLAASPIRAAAASTAAGDSSKQPAKHGGIVAAFTPLSDPAANKKLLAMSMAQCLSSIATLLHDTYLPLFLSEVLGMSNTRMGNLHGMLQFITRASGVISGRLADVLGSARMVIIGVGLTALVCKPMFAVVGNVHVLLGTAACVTWITSAKIIDRLVKGVREAPSKALVGDLAAQSGDSAAAAFSVRQALSTLGMLLGSGAAGLAFQLTGRSYTTTFALSVIPALMGFAMVVAALGKDVGAGDKAHHEAVASLDLSGEPGEPMGLAAKGRALLTALPRGYWQALATAFVLYMARFDVAFITVHASTVMDRASLPLLTPFSMAPVVLLATPMGMQAKKSVRARNTMLALGFAVLIAADLFFAFVPSALGMFLGSTCVGVHMAMTQGVMFGLLASYIPSAPVPGLGRISGMCWSLTDLILGVALAYSNSLAGRLCDFTASRGLGATGCFWGGAVMTGLAILCLLGFSATGELGKEPAMEKKAA